MYLSAYDRRQGAETRGRAGQAAVAPDELRLIIGVQAQVQTAIGALTQAAGAEKKCGPVTEAIQGRQRPEAYPAALD